MRNLQLIERACSQTIAYETDITERLAQKVYLAAALRAIGRGIKARFAQMKKDRYQWNRCTRCSNARSASR
ncbi:MAG: hypothetical protein ABJC63_08720 [Gemmatimonadales bacterium]